jgi:hypothetical protein
MTNHCRLANPCIELLRSAADAHDVGSGTMLMLLIFRWYHSEPPFVDYTPGSLYSSVQAFKSSKFLHLCTTPHPVDPCGLGVTPSASKNASNVESAEHIKLWRM